ncbi:MAG: transposase [Candidatus Hydrogenedentes bacterium]|nr:transposase [Candidatus Hydrogenedentota bacterium]
MPRLARIVVAGEPHHITQRGNNQQDVFFVDDDRRVYLQFLRQYAKRYRLRIHGYCLMTNHVHIIAVPEVEEALANAIGRTHFRYSQYINQLHQRSGHLWQGRFHSCTLDEAHYGNAMHYVEQNPVRAKMVRKPWRYPWSSAAVHVGERKDDGLLDLDRWREIHGNEARWRAVLEQGIDPDFAETFRRNTHTGRPLGTAGFLSMLEAQLGRRLRALPVGRPRKIKTGGGRRN